MAIFFTGSPAIGASDLVTRPLPHHNDEDMPYDCYMVNPKFPKRNQNLRYFELFLSRTKITAP
jgi:hypothetical protein